MNEHTQFVINDHVKYKSKIIIGDDDCYQVTVHVAKHFNWFQKRMIKLCFGFRIEDYND